MGIKRDEEYRQQQLAAIGHRRQTTGYDGLWHYSVWSQSVCQICFAVVTDEAGHTDWHRQAGEVWTP
jgi:hypothetical protein